MKSWLQLLAEQGLGALPPANLNTLARWRRDYCRASGHVAYCVLGDLCSELHIAWEEGPIRVATAEAMSSAFARDIPTILDSDPETARFVA